MIDLPLRPIAVGLARSLVAATAMGAVLYAAGTHDLSAAAWLLGGAGGVLVFVAVVVATGELRPREVRALLRRT